MNNNQNETVMEQNNPGYCTKIFEVDGRIIINAFRCDQPSFTTVDSWNLQRQRKFSFSKQ